MTKTLLKNNEKGVVLVTALLVLGMLTILSVAAVIFTTGDSQVTANYKIYQQTFYDNEGALELVPGVLRRTIAIQTESNEVLTSMRVEDDDDDGIEDDDGEEADGDDADELFDDDIAEDDDENGTPDLVDTVMGYTANPYTIKVKSNSYVSDVEVEREGAINIPGYSTGFATGYGGGSITGKAINYTNTATRDGEKGSRSKIVTTYQCTEKGGGGCL